MNKENSNATFNLKILFIKTVIYFSKTLFCYVSFYNITINFLIFYVLRMKIYLSFYKKFQNVAVMYKILTLLNGIFHNIFFSKLKIFTVIFLLYFPIFFKQYLLLINVTLP